LHEEVDQIYWVEGKKLVTQTAPIKTSEANTTRHSVKEAPPDRKCRVSVHELRQERLNARLAESPTTKLGEGNKSEQIHLKSRLSVAVTEWEAIGEGGLSTRTACAGNQTPPKKIQPQKREGRKRKNANRGRLNPCPIRFGSRRKRWDIYVWGTVVGEEKHLTRWA